MPAPMQAVYPQATWDWLAREFTALDARMAAARARRPAREIQVAAVAIAILLAQSGWASAAEYGVATYRTGLMDLSAGFLPPAGGTLIKGLFLYQDAHLDAVTSDGKIAAHTHTTIYATAIFAAHASHFSILGANWTIGALIPSLIADQNARIGPAGLAVPAQTSTVGGLGEMEFSPCMLNWNFGRLHLASALFFYAPSGGYDKDRIVNTGMNRWAIEPDASVTWLDEQTGLEASAMLGYTISSENSSTHYRSGDEFHADFVLAKRFTSGSILGAAVYALQQTTADSGSGAVMGAFRSRMLALGRMIGQTVRVGEMPITFTFKYEFEFAAQNYATGNALWFGAAIRL
jgi:hypothetical protein